MDKWILAAVNELVEFVRKEMAAYRLYTVVPQLVKFIDQLTNWYVRLNRRRLKGSGGEQDSRIAIATLYEVVLTVVRMMSPFTPFLAEYFYQNLRKILPADQAEECTCFRMCLLIDPSYPLCRLPNTTARSYQPSYCRVC
jgi:isoleucyl-tRNA synthetase